MTTIAIIQSAYIPWKGYFDIISRADRFVLYDCVQYTDRDWRNRNRIKTAHGLQWLTIPVHAAREDRICDVLCTAEEWRNTHWKAIYHAYAKAPFFPMYADVIKELYQSSEPALSDVNLHFLSGICGLLGINTPIELLKEPVITEGDKTDKLIAVCQKYHATRYLSGPMAKVYLDMKKFADAGIEVEWMAYDHYSEYPQLYPPFEHGVTILDMLFNIGPEWENYMARS